MAATGDSALSIFLSWSGTAEDRVWRNNITTCLKRLRNRYHLTWSDEHAVPAGLERENYRQSCLQRARLIILIISPDYLAKEECMRVAREAFARQQQEPDRVRVVPIYAREVYLQGTIFEQRKLVPDNPLKSWKDRDAGLKQVEEELADTLNELRAVPVKQSVLTPQDRERLLPFIVDWRPVAQRHLRDFVGREQERKAVRQHIEDLQDQGGYLAITAPAGEGKSSLIAQLIIEEEQRGQQIPAYFIPMQPGPNGQSDLLRHILASLVYKHQLSASYVDVDRDSLPLALRRLLTELSQRGIRETIYIDGLDQLLPEPGGRRELSWLPEELPKGIVFVLSLRPDETLATLKTGRRLIEYQLPHLSQSDFSALLAQRNVRLPIDLVERYYRSLRGNALYLSLLTGELAQQQQQMPITPSHAEDVLRQIESNPADLFRPTLERLKSDLALWEKLLYPLLAVLVVAQEPLSEGQLRSILGLTHERCQEGLRRLGGLLTHDGQGRYELYHLKLREYLQGETEYGQEQSGALLAPDEVAAWHTRLAKWCAGDDLSLIWRESYEALERQRRQYARRHFIRHLYLGGVTQWQQLFSVLDDGHYSRQKLQADDGGGKALVLDLDLGRRAAGWNGWSQEEALSMQPRLVAYTLLRCLLASQANGYPSEAFGLLVALEGTNKARGLAALITEARWRIEALLAIVRQLGKQAAQSDEWRQAYDEAKEEIAAFDSPDRKDDFYGELARLALAVGERQRASQTVDRIADDLKRAELRLRLAESWLKEGESEPAREALAEASKLLTSQARSVSTEVLASHCALLYRRLNQPEHAQAALSYVQDALQRARYHLALGCLYEEQGQYDLAKREWDQMRQELQAVKNDKRRAEIWLELAEHWLESDSGQVEQVQAILDKLEQHMQRQADPQLWSKLALAWVQAGRWEKAEQIESRLADSRRRLHLAIELALIALERGERWRAIQIWQRIRPDIELLAESWRRPMLGELAKALAALDAWEELRAVIDRGSTPLEQDYLWKEACKVLRRRFSLLREEERALIKIPRWQEARQKLQRLATRDKGKGTAPFVRGQHIGGPSAGDRHSGLVLTSLWNGSQFLSEADKKASSPASEAPEFQVPEKRPEDSVRQLQRAWCQARTIAEARECCAHISGLLPRAPSLAEALLRACDWVERFVQGQEPLPPLDVPGLPEQPKEAS